MTADRLLGYCLTSAWVGGLFYGSADLWVRGHWLSGLVPLVLGLLSVVLLLLRAPRDLRDEER